MDVQTQWCHYLERCCACILSADGVAVVGPHDLINPVAFKGQRLLWRHHAQFLQLQEETLLPTPTVYATTFTLCLYLYVCSLNTMSCRISRAEKIMPAQTAQLQCCIKIKCLQLVVQTDEQTRADVSHLHKFEVKCQKAKKRVTLPSKSGKSDFHL